MSVSPTYASAATFGVAAFNKGDQPEYCWEFGPIATDHAIAVWGDEPLVIMGTKDELVVAAKKFLAAAEGLETPRTWTKTVRAYHEVTVEVYAPDAKTAHELADDAIAAEVGDATTQTVDFHEV